MRSSVPAATPLLLLTTAGGHAAQEHAHLGTSTSRRARFLDTQ